MSRWLASRTAAWVTLVACLGLVAVVWNFARQFVAQEQADQFQVEAERTLTALVTRLGNYEQVLIAGSAFFVADDGVTRGEWGSFVAAQRVQERYPGIQGVGFAAWVSKDDREAHVAGVRSRGLADYDIRPPGPRDFHVPIVFNEPYVGRNTRVVGFDMYSEATRRRAIDHARATGRTAMSGKVVLAGEQPEERPPGFVMYAPIRRPGGADIQGFVFAPFRMGDFMSGFLSEQATKVGYRIYDGERTTPDALMYEDPESLRMTGAARALAKSARIVFAGRTWTLDFVAPMDFDPMVDTKVPWMILAIGGLISLLVFALMQTLYVARQSVARFRDYANLASDWLWEMDDELRFTYHSGIDTSAIANFTELFLGRTRREFFERHGDPAEKDVWDRLDDLAQRRQPYKDVTYSLFADNKKRLYYRISGAPVFDPQGGFVGYRGVGKDVTDEARRAEETRQAKTTAELASASKTRFLAMMSHELRTPLNAIIGFADLLANPTGRPAEAMREYARDIATSSRHLLDMINHILDMSKIESGKLDLLDETVDLKRAIKACVALVAPKADQGGIVLGDEVPETAPRLRADSRAVRQIVVNLLSNAVKFTPRGGSVSIRLEQRASGGLALVVEDDGIGIAPSALARVFQPFQQADASIARRFGGTGLGLPISKALMDAFGGALEIESALGKGTKASAVFPASRVSA